MKWNERIVKSLDYVVVLLFSGVLAIVILSSYFIYLFAFHRDILYAHAVFDLLGTTIDISVGLGIVVMILLVRLGMTPMLKIKDKNEVIKIEEETKEEEKTEDKETKEEEKEENVEEEAGQENTEKAAEESEEEKSEDSEEKSE